MIIKNNFNDKDVNPLNNYRGIGKGSNSIENQLEREKNGQTNNPILKDIIASDSEFNDEDKKEDKWDFFK